MNRKDYKRLIDQIEPDEGLEQQIIQKLRAASGNMNINKGRGRSGMNQWLKRAAGLAVIACLGLVIALTWNHKSQTMVTSVDPGLSPNVNKIDDPQSVTIPKIELPKESNVSADMIGLIVYKGNVYTQTSTSITPEIAKQLRGDQLGRTTSGIDEWSSASDYTEMASTIGEMDVFSVKGYDPDFRIMSYLEIDGQIYAELYEHLNGITITKGEDLIGKLNLKDHVESVKWQDFNSWNNSEMKFKELQADQGLQQFISALYEAKPVAGDKLYEAGIYETAPENQKFLYLKLQDHTEVQLRLFKDGNYVSYGIASVFFQVDSAVFDAFWEQM
ncbi:hypothetical protein [Paenibacillus dakarensis]|uniref:hypothetical protein n=1 Tax=Paenibacillus dakarensis TaxID=1527293 RepID=UPI0006D58460|nr:hypothetical protein [Paenibacillus dakarensis]